MRKIFEVGCVALLALLGGCGQELLAGGQREGEVSAVVTDDAAPPSPSMEPSRFLAASSPGAFSTTSALPQGTVEVDGSVTLLRENGVATALASGRAATARVRIASADSAVLATRTVRATHYTLARVTFTRIEAEVTSGLVVGGVGLSGRIVVPLDQPLTIDAPISLTVDDRGEHRVTIDLNASAWLLATHPVLRTVPQAAFASAVRVSAR